MPHAAALGLASLAGIWACSRATRAWYCLSLITALSSDLASFRSYEAHRRAVSFCPMLLI